MRSSSLFIDYTSTQKTHVQLHFILQIKMLRHTHSLRIIEEIKKNKKINHAAPRLSIYWNKRRL